MNCPKNPGKSVQMEFGTDYREKAALDQSSSDAAKGIVAFYEAYLRKPSHCWPTRPVHEDAGSRAGRR